MTDDELLKRFTYHAPTPEKIETHQDIRELGKQFAEYIDGCAYDSREKSLAITKVEEAVMWANAAVAREGA
jgi:hypothetical protein